MGSGEERSIVDSDNSDRGSIHSDWSDLLPVNEEAEYGKVYKNRKGPNTVGVATTSGVSTGKAPVIPSAPPAKNTVKNIALVPYMPRLNHWGSWQIRSPYVTTTKHVFINLFE